MSRKAQERTYLDSFFRAVGWPCTPSDVQERESPDFVVALQGRMVGVEIVQVFADQTPRKSKMREGESIRLSWLSGLAKDYYDAGGPSARVQLQFQPSYFEKIRGEIPEELRARILERLVDLVRRMKPGDHLTRRIRGERESLLVTLWIWALPPSFGRYSRWRLGNDAVGWGRRLLPVHVEDLIAKKAALLPEYRRCASEVVLVIVADKFLASGMIIWEGTHLSPQGFEGVYLLHFPEGEVDRIA
jgi:hypothetical protein